MLLSFSADGVRLLSCEGDGLTPLSSTFDGVKFFCSADGVLFLSLVTDRVTPLSFSGDGDSLAAERRTLLSFLANSMTSLCLSGDVITVLSFASLVLTSK